MIDVNPILSRIKETEIIFVVFFLTTCINLYVEFKKMSNDKYKLDVQTMILDMRESNLNLANKQALENKKVENNTKQIIEEDKQKTAKEQKIKKLAQFGQYVTTLFPEYLHLKGNSNFFDLIYQRYLDMSSINKQ